MRKEKYVIWSSEVDVDDYSDYLEEEYPGASEEQKFEIVQDMNLENLGDEKLNLNFEFDNNLIVIGDLGLWNGRVFGHKVIRSKKLRDCFELVKEYGEYYVDSKTGDFRATDHHHDGTNHYTIRVFKDGVDEQILLDAIYDNDPNLSEKINRYTGRLGDVVADVYGWKLSIRGRKPQIERRLK